MRQLASNDAAASAVDNDAHAADLPGPSELLEELDAAGNGLVMTMGKGGVGKTTLAAAVAVALVDRGHQVTLSTTDPAAHLTDTLAGSAPDELLVERIDPAVETARYTDEILAAATGLDDDGRTLLVEDLRSPCTEEIAVFRAFVRTIDAAPASNRRLDHQRPGLPGTRRTRCCAPGLAARPSTSSVPSSSLRAGRGWSPGSEPPIGAVALRPLAADAARSEPALGA